MSRSKNRKHQWFLLPILMGICSLFALAIVSSYARDPIGAALLRFEVSVAPGLMTAPEDGRLYIILGKRADVEPRLSVGRPGRDATPILARDVSKPGAGGVAVLDGSAAAFPISYLAQVVPGEYWVQAVFDHNRDLRLVNAPGNLYSVPTKTRIEPLAGSVVKIELTRQLPADSLPPETADHKFIKLRSELLSAFHGRPMYLRAGVVLPHDFERAPPYPLRVHIGGYGSRYTTLPRNWNSTDGQPMVVLVLDGAGPFGDPYQVNSANNGPYGDALVRELIPHVERQFHCIGKPYARVLDGGSTGGWVSLALQVFYPDFFIGTWSACPDSVDFRSFQLIDIYKDKNAYVNEKGFERPAARTIDGDVLYTMRHECQMENVLGGGDSWTRSGGQWGAWNATYGPRGADGLPVPLWDPKTGAIHHEAVEHWKQYDLRLVLENNWQDLGPKLRGKLHIGVGEADTFFLNNAVHRLDTFLSRTNPPYEGSIIYGPRQGHCWGGLTDRQIREQMAKAIEAGKQAAQGR
jgi:hypothetical protein